MTSTTSGSTRARVYVSLVLYADRADGLIEAIARIDRELDRSFEHHEIVVVDDRIVPDPSRELAEVGLQGELVHVRLARRHGVDQGTAAGLTRAVGDFVFEVDHVDSTWPVGTLHELYRRAANGVDIVAAVVGPPPPLRRALFGLIGRWSGLELTGEVDAIRVVSRRALAAMLALPERFRYRPALYAATGFSRESVQLEGLAVPPSERRRMGNVGRAVDIAVSLTNVGSRLAIYFALGFLALAGAFSVYTVSAFLVLEDVERGWTTLMLLLSMGLAGIFLVLALLGEYSSRLIAEVLRHPVYVVRDTQVIHGAGPRDGERSLPALHMAVPDSDGPGTES